MNKPSKTKSKENHNYISDEASNGLSFAHILFGTGLALIGLLVSNPPKSSLASLAIFAILLVFSSFYASLFYANVHGSLRTSDFRSYMKAIYYGNAFTEYFGVFLLSAIFPVFVFSYTSNITLTTSCYIIVSIGFLIYSFSGFDLLSRPIRNPALHAAVCITFLLVVGINTYCIVLGNDLMKLMSSGAVIIFLGVITLVDIGMLIKNTIANDGK